MVRVLYKRNYNITFWKNVDWRSTIHDQKINQAGERQLVSKRAACIDFSLTAEEIDTQASSDTLP